MLSDTIRQQCWARYNQLLDTHFTDDPRNPEFLSGRYTIDLPLLIAAQMHDYIEALWEANGDGRSLNDLMGAGRLTQITYESYLERLRETMHDALKVTLWEKITKTNYQDVAVYKGILKECTKEILETMITDFLNE